ncbi:TPA: transposase [Escherichia coli]|nr:transposase [Escherichia coli]
MNDISSDDIFLLKQRLAEQEALIHALQEKLSNREREIDHLQAQLDKLRRMNFGSRSEKVSRRIAQMEADLNRLQKESDTLTGRVAPAVWFAYSPDRKGIHPQTHLACFSGVLQADAYAGFNELYRNGGITEAACWAHARRKIHDVHVRIPSALTEEALEQIGQLYAIEADIRGMPAEQRLAERQRKTKPLLKSLESWLREKMKTLFFGSGHGGERGALLYSLIGTCKLNDVDPESYLRHVPGVIADWPVNRVSELLPWRIALPAE